MAKPHPDGDRARALAQQVYDTSEKCLMAHSICAVEQIVEKETSCHHRIRVLPSPPKRFLGRRAIAVIQAELSEILVDSEVGFEHQRLGIAHELAHVLFCRLDGLEKRLSAQRDRQEEDACGVFEKELCKKHDQFYSKPENIARLRFQSLAED